MKHGIPGTYTNYGCRCDRCRKAWRAYKREYAVRRQSGELTKREEVQMWRWLRQYADILTN